MQHACLNCGLCVRQGAECQFENSRRHAAGLCPIEQRSSRACMSSSLVGSLFQLPLTACCQRYTANLTSDRGAPPLTRAAYLGHEWSPATGNQSTKRLSQCWALGASSCREWTSRAAAGPRARSRQCRVSAAGVHEGHSTPVAVCQGPPLPGVTVGMHCAAG